MMKKLFVLSVALLTIGLTPALAASHWLGSQRALVLLLEWKNEPAKHSAAEMNDIFFADGKMSLRDYFNENSQGAFDFRGEVRDWKGTATRWDSGASCDLDQIMREAWSVFGSSVDVSKYDADGNGKIDNLFVIHSGRINSDRVGPDCTFTTFAKADHAIVFQQEGIGKIGNSVAIGFYLHEAGHGYFNLPDLYSDHYHGRYGIGMWGIMGLGAWGTTNEMRTEDMFRFPSHFEPASKVRIGWVKPRVLRTTTTGVRLRPVEKTGDIVAVPVSGGATYYLEYRTPTGFSANHKGHGLLIWKDLKIIQADGRDDLNHGNDLGRRPVPPNNENFGDSSDPFPGSGNVRTYEDRRAGLRFENIAERDGYIELDVRMLPGFKSAPLRKGTNPVTPNFDFVERL